MPKNEVLNQFLAMARDARKGLLTLPFNEKTSCLRYLITELRTDIARNNLTLSRLRQLRAELERNSPKDSVKYRTALAWLEANWPFRPPIPDRAKRVFELSNQFYQGFGGGGEGICTVASLDWCKKCLKKGGRVDSKDELTAPHFLNIQMATLRRLDAAPQQQTELAGLRSVGGDQNITSVDQALNIIGTTPPHVGIFWTGGHTMGYRHSPTANEEEFFDIEQGLFRAATLPAIITKINEHYAGQVRGCRVVRLA